MRSMVGYIPSPEHGTIDIGPLQLHAYGLMLAIGVLTAAKSADARGRRAGNDSKVIAEIAVPVVVAGVIGARIYHLFTGYKWNDGGILGALEIWKGGLSIWGAVAGGLLAVMLISRRR
jgi:prolipoprotein diacylglyceryltransferase